jgi:hypothetical protein
MKKNTEAFVVGSEEVGLAVNADETNYMVLYLDQQAWQNHSKGWK